MKRHGNRQRMQFGFRYAKNDEGSVRHLSEDSRQASRRVWNDLELRKEVDGK